jgi:two-component system sensor histidine kinase HydH
LRVRLVVVDAPIAAAVSRAREVQAAAFVGGGLLLLLAVLAFLADRRTARVQRQLAAQQRLAEMGEMAAVLAHEIRNPLGVIKGYAQLLREGAGPQGQETLGRVVAESGRLERLVNGLLDYARPPAPRLAEVDAAPVVERACELVAEEAQARQVRLLQDLEPGAARVDPDQLQQVALNLIRNAVQASSPGDTVTVRLKLRAAELRLSVTDGGPGLPPELGEDIFKPFVTTRADGTGLGLAISRQIAEAHGGSLRALPGRDGGATFLLTVPLGHAGGKQGGA